MKRPHAAQAAFGYGGDLAEDIDRGLDRCDRGLLGVSGYAGEGECKGAGDRKGAISALGAACFMGVRLFEVKASARR